MIKFLTAIPAIVWLLASGLLNALGEYLSKLWGINSSVSLTLLVALAYGLSSVIWLPALLHKNQLSTMGVAWVLIALLSTLFLGLFVFHEQLAVTQWIGVAFAIIAVLFLVL